MPNIVKNTTFPSLLDLIAPHSCRGCGRIGNALCDRCKKYIITNNSNICPICKSNNRTGICPKCHKNHPDIFPFFTIGQRSDLLDAIIHDLKYNSIRPLAKTLAQLISQSLPEPINPTIIVPLPTIGRHIRERGLDHTALIAKQLAKTHPNYQTKSILLRNNNTVQVGSNRDERIIQAKHAYTINPKIRINPKVTYLLLDDVWTTGASLMSANQKLRQAGVKDIITVALSVSQIS